MKWWDNLYLKEGTSEFIFCTHTSPDLSHVRFRDSGMFIR